MRNDVIFNFVILIVVGADFQLKQIKLVKRSLISILTKKVIKSSVVAFAIFSC